MHPGADVLGSMAQDDNNLFNSRGAQMGQARFNDRLVTERQQGFEFAHPPRAAGSEENCGNVLHCLIAAAGGSQSSTRLPSRSMIQPKLPNSDSSVFGSTSTPSARSWASNE